MGGCASLSNLIANGHSLRRTGDAIRFISTLWQPKVGCPKRSVVDLFEASQAEIDSVWQLANIRKKQIAQEDGLVTGFNFGVNSGEAAGQTIQHLHFHLIPRRKGDTPNPTGGVRGVIPEKMNYRK